MQKSQTADSSSPIEKSSGGIAHLELGTIVEGMLRGAISPHVALLRMLTEAPLEEVAAAIGSLADGPDRADGPLPIRASELVTLFEENRDRCAAIARALETQPDFYSDADSDAARVAHYAALFDGLVLQSPEASVAAYTLGREDVLDEATAEIVRFMLARGLIDRSKAILQIGCGIGRFESALSPLVASATGIDISAGMIAAARERCSSLPNVILYRSSGLDLAFGKNEQFDLVYAVDSFPYIVAVGPTLVETYFAETARVLKRHGDFLILNYSYRDAIDQDAGDVTRLAREHHFRVVSAAETPFHLWDGTVFHLRKHDR